MAADNRLTILIIFLLETCPGDIGSRCRLEAVQNKDYGPDLQPGTRLDADAGGMRLKARQF
jgi:hypothetical protein